MLGHCCHIGANSLLGIALSRMCCECFSGLVYASLAMVGGLRDKAFFVKWAMLSHFLKLL